MLWVTLRWISISSRGSRNVPSRYITVYTTETRPNGSPWLVHVRRLLFIQGLVITVEGSREMKDDEFCLAHGWNGFSLSFIDAAMFLATVYGSLFM